MGICVVNLLGSSVVTANTGRGGRSLGPLSESGEAQTDHKGFGKCLCRESRFIDIERKSDQRCKNFHRWAVICQKP